MVTVLSARESLGWQCTPVGPTLPVPPLSRPEKSINPKFSLLFLRTESARCLPQWSLPGEEVAAFLLASQHEEKGGRVGVGWVLQ